MQKMFVTGIYYLVYRALVGVALAPNQPVILVSVNEIRNPRTTNRRAQSWASATASGIMVSTIIANMPPAATAVVTATMKDENAPKTAYPASDARPQAMAIAVHTPKT